MFNFTLPGFTSINFDLNFNFGFAKYMDRQIIGDFFLYFFEFFKTVFEKLLNYEPVAVSFKYLGYIISCMVLLSLGYFLSIVLPFVEKICLVINNHIINSIKKYAIYIFPRFLSFMKSFFTVLITWTYNLKKSVENIFVRIKELKGKNNDDLLKLTIELEQINQQIKSENERNEERKKGIFKVFF